MKLRTHLMMAWKGKRIWRHLIRKYNIGNKDIVVFLIEEDDELNYYACLYLPDILLRKSSNKAYIVSPYASNLEGLENVQLHGGTKIEVGIEEARQIMKYYQLVKFSNYVYFISLTWPPSNLVYRLLGKHGVNKEDIVCLGIYSLRIKPYRDKCYDE